MFGYINGVILNISFILLTIGITLFIILTGLGICDYLGYKGKSKKKKEKRDGRN